jgi:hypothetical protein
LVGFGSVIDLGIHTDLSLGDAKNALENLKNAGSNGEENVRKVDEAIGVER